MTARVHRRGRLGAGPAAVAFVVASLLGVVSPGVAAAVAHVERSTGASAQEVPVSWSVRPGPSSSGGDDRANFDFEAAPGDTIEDSLIVENQGRATLVLGIVANDAFNTPTGGVDILPSDEEPSDVGAWITASTRSVTVAPGESVTVPFTVTVPEDTPSGDHSGGIVTSLRVSDTDSTGNRVVHERRLGSRMHVRVDGELDPALEFTKMSTSYRGTANPFAPGSMSVTYTVANPGNVRLRATQRITVKGQFGLEQSIEVADMAELLPGNEYEFTHEVPGVWPALSTTTEVALEPYGVSGQRLDPEPSPVVARSTSQLLPVAQIVLAILVAAGVVGLVVMRSRSKSKMDKAVDAAVAEALKDAAAGGATPPR